MAPEKSVIRYFSQNFHGIEGKGTTCVSRQPMTLESQLSSRTLIHTKHSPYGPS